MAQFHIYLDESGKLQQKTDYTCICGYLADGGTWERFSAQWNRVRLRWDVPPVHMAKLMKPVGPNIAYKSDDWDNVRVRWGANWEPIRNEMLREFAQVISSLAVVALGVIVDAVAYRKLRDESSPATYDDPNVFAFHRVIMDGLAKIERVERLGTLSIIVDNDPEHAWGYYNLANGLRNHPDKAVFSAVGDRLHAVCFGDDKAYPGLQAADMLSWLSRRYMVDKKQAADHLPSDLLRLLTFDGLHQPVVFTDAILKEVSEGTIRALNET
jgi:hypothetical protein